MTWHLPQPSDHWCLISALAFLRASDNYAWQSNRTQILSQAYSPPISIISPSLLNASNVHLLSVCLGSALTRLTGMSEMAGVDRVYRDPKAPVEARIKDLLSRMTLEEKVGQMTQIELQVATPDAIKGLSIGSMVSGPGNGPFEKALSSDWAEMVDGFQKSALESRLGIPLIYGIDAVHGNCCVYGATIFPHNVGLGATRDADLCRKIGEATALEVRASGIHYTFAPCVAVCRDPRWGRCYESYSEDTEIVKKMTSLVTGLQGQPPCEHPKGYPFSAGRWR